MASESQINMASELLHECSHTPWNNHGSVTWHNKNMDDYVPTNTVLFRFHDDFSRVFLFPCPSQGRRKRSWTPSSRPRRKAGGLAARAPSGTTSQALLSSAPPSDGSSGCAQKAGDPKRIPNLRICLLLDPSNQLTVSNPKP